MSNEVEKPLHVRVAEALGQSLHYDPKWPAGRDHGWHGDLRSDSYEVIPEYHVDWEATGPLIEEYGISIKSVGHDLSWIATVAMTAKPRTARDFFRAKGDTPLEAVCHLLLAMKAAGRL